MDATRVELIVLGEKITIRTAEPPEYLRTLARFVEERVQSMSAGHRPQTTALILAALDIADELFRAREELYKYEGDLPKRIGAMVDLLDAIVPTKGSR